MKMHYYILQWCDQKQMFEPACSAFFPSGLPKKKPEQRYATSHYSIDKRINGKQLPKCKFGQSITKGK